MSTKLGVWLISFSLCGHVPCALVVTHHSCQESEGKEKGGRAAAVPWRVRRVPAESLQTRFLQDHTSGPLQKQSSISPSRPWPETIWESSVLLRGSRGMCDRKQVAVEDPSHSSVVHYSLDGAPPQPWGGPSWPRLCDLHSWPLALPLGTVP